MRLILEFRNIVSGTGCSFILIMILPVSYTHLNVDLICGRYIVDAKSMLGVFSLPTFDDVELGVEEEDLSLIHI